MLPGFAPREEAALLLYQAGIRFGFLCSELSDEHVLELLRVFGIGLQVNERESCGFVGDDDRRLRAVGRAF